MAADQKGKAKRAIAAMRGLGVSDATTKSVLKKLIKLYDRNWDLIEEENYRVLADAIFEEEEEMAAQQGKKSISDDEEDEASDEPEQPLRRPETRNLRQVVEQERDPPAADIGDETPDTVRPFKRLRRGHRHVSPCASEPMTGPVGILLKEPKVEKDEMPCLNHQSQVLPQLAQLNNASLRTESQSVSPEPNSGNKGKEKLVSSSSMMIERGDQSVACTIETSQQQTFSRSQNDITSQVLPAEGSSHATCSRESAGIPGIMLLPKQVSETCMSVMPRDEPINRETPADEIPLSVIHPDEVEADFSNGIPSADEPNCHISSVSNPPNGNSESEVNEASPNEQSPSFELHLKVPNLDELLKSVEEKYLRSYKIPSPNFASDVLNLIVEGARERGTVSLGQSSSSGSICADQERERLVTISPSFDLLNKSLAEKLYNCDKKEFCGSPSPCNASNESVDAQCFEQTDELNSRSLVVVPRNELTPDDLRTLCKKNDLTKGFEDVEIPWINQVGGSIPPPFCYISTSLVYHHARVDFSLSQIGDHRCCEGCRENCLELPLSCACVQETEGCFAYTSEGLLKEEFLEGCISLTRSPGEGCLSYCKECPIERKNDDAESCKGHLVRKFIKECWYKCGCDLQCGNRVVQRGITRKLQVFYTPDGKGWGLRTMEALPKGAFVCEYAGEIVTYAELHMRKMCNMNSMQNTHPIILDAAWNSMVLKDEEALCLDATNFGNVARFINHRCFDANLIEIPVEVETPYHNYYHLAFFTTRNVDALEELTWDYGIDFEDEGHLFSNFRCKCGSKFCRDMKRSNRSRHA